jgi:hypothetical protein
MAAGVNPDASLFCRAPGSGLVERRGGVALSDHSGSAVRHTEASSAGRAGRSLRHNKSGRDRSSCRSQPAAGSPRRGTAALTLPRHGTPTRLVDERHDCQDIGPAYVPSTVWSTASSLTAKFRSAPCLPLDTDKSTLGQLAAVFIGAPVASNATPSRHQIQTPLRTHRTSGGRRHCKPSGVARRINADLASHRKCRRNIPPAPSAAPAASPRVVIFMRAPC